MHATRGTDGGYRLGAGAAMPPLLLDDDEAVNRKRVERIMRERGIVGVTRRRRRSLTKPDATAAPTPDLIGRDFTAPAPGQRFVGDIIYLHTATGRPRTTSRSSTPTTGSGSPAPAS